MYVGLVSNGSDGRVRPKIAASSGGSVVVGIADVGPALAPRRRSVGASDDRRQVIEGDDVDDVVDRVVAATRHRAPFSNDGSGASLPAPR